MNGNIRTQRLRAALAATILAATTLSGCATFGFGPQESSVDRALSFINDGSAAELIAMSAVPFVLDGEILMRRGDVESLWTTLKEQGFSLAGAQVVSVDPVDEESYRLFSESTEMAIHVSKHVPKGAYTARVKSSRGAFVLMLGQQKGGVLQILGIGGPA